MKPDITRYSWQLAPEAVRSIREQVFIREQKVTPALEWDDSDEVADHYLAVLPDRTPVAVARLILTLDETAHIGRMAVLPGYRGQGIGSALLRRLMQESASRAQELRLSAQQHAVPFYQCHGFHVCAEAHEEAGIPHFLMRCLAPAQVSRALEQPDTRPPHPMLLGEDTGHWPISQEQDLPPLLDNLAGQAVQRLWLYDRLLDHELYDRERLRDILSRLARRHPTSEVRLLIHDDKPLVQRRHQLIELMRRLPSHISLRLINRSHPASDQPFILADRNGVLLRHRFERPEGFVCFDDEGRVRQLAEQFQRMWDHGRTSAEFRELSI